MCAARNNRLSVVNFLLDSLEHVDVDELDGDRQSALHHAALAGHREVTARIVQAGASTRLLNKVGIFLNLAFPNYIDFMFNL